MKLFFILLFAAIAIFILILLFNAFRAKLSSRKLTERPGHIPPEEQIKYAERLGEMIRCKTVSVPNDFDGVEFSKLRKVMEDLFPTLHKTAERLVFGDDCWVYKIKGRDESRNVLLMSHHDVVDVTDDWLHPGFCGEIFENKLWGRGTIDTKTSLFAEFMALEELLREGFEPPCNIYVASSHNEEISGDGIPLALRYFKEKNITFEVVLDEGGAIISPPLPGIKSNCAMMAVHEKGRYTLVCKTKEINGHTGLAARADTPVARLSAFITEVNTKNVFTKKLYPQVKAMFSHLSPYTPFLMTVIFSNLWCFGSLLKALMPKINPQAGSMVSTTCTFNEINTNKEEKSCSAKAFIRCIDHDDMLKDMEKIKKIAKKYNVELIPGTNEYFISADLKHSAFAYTKKCIEEIFPDVVAAPYILPAGTDARHLCEISPCVIRFAPIEMDDSQFASVHAKNENINIRSIADSVVFYKHFVKNYK